MSEDSSQEQESPGEQLAVRLRIATELLSLAYMIYVIWIMLVPEHKRRQILMQAAESIRRLAARAASRTARQAMTLELSGRATNYELPYRLSQLRDKAGRWYEKLRYS